MGFMTRGCCIKYFLFEVAPSSNGLLTIAGDLDIKKPFFDDVKAWFTPEDAAKFSKCAHDFNVCLGIDRMPPIQQERLTQGHPCLPQNTIVDAEDITAASLEREFTKLSFIISKLQHYAGQVDTKLAVPERIAAPISAQPQPAYIESLVNLSETRIPPLISAFMNAHEAGRLRQCAC